MNKSQCPRKRISAKVWVRFLLRFLVAYIGIEALSRTFGPDTQFLVKVVKALIPSALRTVWEVFIGSEVVQEAISRLRNYTRRMCRNLEQWSSGLSRLKQRSLDFRIQLTLAGRIGLISFLINICIEIE